jgi:addiction module RelB/DinJ family antitoxin
MGVALVQARIDEKVKNKAEKYIKEWGLDTATAIKLYFKNIADNGKLPFIVGNADPTYYDTDFVKMIMESEKTYNPKSKKYNNAKEIRESLR